MNTEESITQSYLTFRLEGELFAVTVSKVLEILEIRQITKVPQTPVYMRGVLNLRGSVLPVIDTKFKFGMSKTEDTIDTCILVLAIEMDGESLTIGALVDAVQEVIELDDRQIGPSPSIGSKYRSDFIKGMIKLNEQFIMLVDLDKIFSSEEMFLLNDPALETKLEN